MRVQSPLVHRLHQASHKHCAEYLQSFPHLNRAMSSSEDVALVSHNLHEFSNLSISADVKAATKRPIVSIPVETYAVKCPNSGVLNIIVQGNRSANEVCVLTAHDLGCNWKEFDTFINHPSMQGMASRVVWVHLTVPGQEEDAQDLPANYKFPSLQELADDIPTIMDQINISSVVLFGEGAGANVLFRFGLSNDERVLGMVLLNATATSAGFMEMHREKAAVGRRLSRAAMTSAIENRLAEQRFGAGGKSVDGLNESVSNYCEYLRKKINQRNLAMYANAYYDRSNLTNSFGHLQCQLLLIAGAKSEHSHVVHTLHAAMLRSFKSDAAKRRLVEFMRVDDVVSVMHQKPEKLAESLQYFLQGLGLLSGISRLRATPLIESQPAATQTRARSLSMVDYDKPRGAAKIIFDPERKYSEV